MVVEVKEKLRIVKALDLEAVIFSSNPKIVNSLTLLSVFHLKNGHNSLIYVYMVLLDTYSSRPSLEMWLLRECY